MRSFPLICIPLEIPTLIPRIPTPIPRIPAMIPRIPTLISHIPIISLLPFPDSPFRFLQITDLYRGLLVLLGFRQLQLSNRRFSRQLWTLHCWIDGFGDSYSNCRIDSFRDSCNNCRIDSFRDTWNNCRIDSFRDNCNNFRIDSFRDTCNNCRIDGFCDTCNNCRIVCSSKSCGIDRICQIESSWYTLHDMHRKSDDRLCCSLDS